MKIHFIFIFSVILLFFGCEQQKNPNAFTLKGHTIGMDSGMAIITYLDSADQKISDTARIVDEKFIFNGFIKQPTRVLVQIAGKGQYLYFEPKEMQLTADTAHFIHYSLSGSETQKMNDRLQEVFVKYMEPMREKSTRINEINEKLKSESTISVRDSLEREKLKYTTERDEIKNKVDQEQNELLLNSPSFLTVLHFDRFDEWPIDSQKNIIDRLPIEIRNYPAVKQIEATFIPKANSLKGAQAPDFSTVDINGETVRLSDFKGKMILLDFWASWCGPCRKAIPRLKELYRKYHVKGFDIIAISHDTDQEKWEQSIQEEKTTEWHHLLNVQKIGTDHPDDIKNKFYVRGLPTQLLINKNGKIIGRWVGFSEENEQSIETLLKNQL